MAYYLCGSLITSATHEVYTSPLTKCYILNHAYIYSGSMLWSQIMFGFMHKSFKRQMQQNLLTLFRFCFRFWLRNTLIMTFCPISICYQEARDMFTHELQLELPSQQLKGHLQVRVRVCTTGDLLSQWSNWSPTASWVGPTDTATTSEDECKNTLHFQVVSVATKPT